MELTYVGHGTLLVEKVGTRILTDPVLGARIFHLRRLQPAPPLDDLLPLDGVLLSHSHRDHMDLRSLRSVAADATVVVPHGAARHLRGVHPRQVIEVTAGDQLAIGGQVIEAVSAVHDGGRNPPFGHGGLALGYLVGEVYFAGDTDVFAGMARLAGRAPVATLPVWGWGSRLPKGHMDPEAAADAVALVKPQLAIPIHWGTLRALGTQRDTDPLAAPRRFAEAVARVAPGTEVKILPPGQTLRRPDWAAADARPVQN